MFISNPHQILYDIVISGKENGNKNIVRFLKKEMKVLVFSTKVFEDRHYNRKTVSSVPCGFGNLAQKYDFEEFASIIPDGLVMDQRTGKILMHLSDYDIDVIIEDESTVNTILARIEKIRSERCIILQK